MANITDPIIVSFSKQYLRALGEILTDLRVALEDAKTTYQTSVSSLLGSYLDGDILVDGRASEGVVQLTKEDIVNFITHSSALLAELNSVSLFDRAALRSKMSVRPQGSRFTLGRG